MSFLALEPLLIDRLEKLIPAARQVRSVSDMNEVTNSGENLPAIFVLPNGRTVEKVDSTAKKTKYEERWLVVVKVKCVRRGGSAPDVLRESAGSLLLDVYNALAGWVPAPGLDVLTPISPPDDAISGGFGFFPLAFRTGFVVSAD